MATAPDLLTARKVVANAFDQLSDSALTTDNQIVQEKSKAGDPILRLRFFDEGYQIVEAAYDPVMAAVGFLKSAVGFWQSRLPKDAPEFEELVFASAVNMLVWMLSKMHMRMWIAMGDLGDETWHDWAGRQCALEEKHNRAQGLRVDYKISATRKQLLQGQQKQIRELWEWTKGGSDREYDPPAEQKRLFAFNYPTILQHWEDVNRWCRRDDRPNWRELAKAKPFEDTPNELLDRLEDSSPEGISSLALEHTARRVGMRRPGSANVTEDPMAQASGLSRSTLYRILGEGKNLPSLNESND
jgi:hypothetical protein